MQPLKNITILWDFDGTLFDTYPMYTALFQKVIKEEVRDEEVYQQLKVSFTHAANYFHLSEADVAKVRQLESEWPTSQVAPFPYLETVLKNVGKNVIMTHKARQETERILGEYGWLRYFTEIVSGDDGFPRKPDPAAYEYLHKKHTIDLVVGDRLLDIIPGKKIGAQTCLFQNNEQGADFYLDSYHNFYDKVGKHFSTLTR